VKRVRVGIVGFGKIGRLRAEVVAHHPAMELVAMADPVAAVHGPPAGCAYHGWADSLLPREKVDTQGSEGRIG